jgi:hypothetical protein
MIRLEHLDAAAGILLPDGFLFESAMGKRHRERRTIEWWLQPAHSRTVLVQPTPRWFTPARTAPPPDRVVRTRFEPLLFCVVRHDGAFTTMGTFADYDALGTLTPEIKPSRLLRLFGSNVTGRWKTCLGEEATTLVMRGRLDPFEAYWNTVFADTKPSDHSAVGMLTRDKQLVRSVPLTPRVINWLAGAAAPPARLDVFEDRDIRPEPSRLLPVPAR